VTNLLWTRSKLFVVVFLLAELSDVFQVSFRRRRRHWKASPVTAAHRSRNLPRMWTIHGMIYFKIKRSCKRSVLLKIDVLYLILCSYTVLDMHIFLLVAFNEYFQKKKFLRSTNNCNRPIFLHLCNLTILLRDSEIYKLTATNTTIYYKRSCQIFNILQHAVPCIQHRI